MSGRARGWLGSVDLLIGDEGQKRRLKAIFASISGEITVERACEELGLGTTRYYELRQQVLEGALRSLSPRPVGRPRAARESDEVAELLREQADLREELERLRVREELMLALPRIVHVRPSPPATSEKGGRRSRRGRLAGGKRGA